MGGDNISRVKKKYLLLKLRYDLPDYDVINKELEITTLDSTKFMLRQIRKKIHRRIDDFCDTIEELLQPDTSITQMHECRFFSDTSKNRIFELYKKLMFMSRNASELDILNDKKKDTEFITDFFNEIEEIKTELLKIVRTMKKSWKKEIDKDIKLEYFG